MRSPVAGALCWAAAAPLFLAANAIVGLAWDEPEFSWTTNNISDLGNINCGIWDTSRPRYVCSPWHDAMNVAFVLTSVLLLAGMLLTWRRWGSGRAANGGRGLLLAGMAGPALAGLAPADTHENLHLLAALLIFVCGNAGLVVAGFARGSAGRAMAAAGVLGIVSFVLFFALQNAALERPAVLPLQLWTCAAGVRLLLAARRPAALSRG